MPARSPDRRERTARDRAGSRALIAALLLTGAPLAAAAQGEAAEPEPDYIQPSCQPAEAADMSMDGFPPLIEVEVARSKIKKWIKAQLGAQSNETPNIRAEFKRKFPGTVRWETPAGICSSPADLRITGDWKDHLANDRRSGHPMSSVAIKLEDEHLKHITRFKLLLPVTRNGDIEVLTTVVFRAFGFLAPETRMQAATVNGVTHLYLLQEVPAKEMIERASLRESLLLEGDERAIWQLVYGGEQNWAEHHGFALPDNASWIANPVARRISLDAMSMYSRLYLPYLGSGRLNFTAPEDLLAANHFIRDESLFVLLTHLMGATHALRPHNRKFYYDPMYRQFRPIYYDGNARPFAEPLAVDPAHFRPADIERVRAMFSDPALRSAIFEAYRARGGRIAEREVNALFNLIVDTVGRWSSDAVDPGREVAERRFPPTWNLQQHLRRLNLDAQSFVGYNVGAGAYQRCTARTGSGLECADLDAAALMDVFRAPLDEDAFPVPMIGAFRAGEDGVLTLGFAGNGVRTIDDPPPGEYAARPGETLWFRFSPEASAAPGSPVYRLTTGSDGRASGRFVFSGFVPPALTVSVTSAGTLDNTVRYDGALLTSCLTFVDAELDGVSIESTAAPCEDGVNFLRVFGSVASLSVEGAAADAIDADFSTLLMNEVSVADAGNDCIDLSMGRYRVGAFTGRGCGDKGISVGEGALAEVARYTVSGALSGAVVKDGAELRLGEGKLDASDYCFQAYRKKQEFGGGVLRMPRAIAERCDAPFFVHDGSELRLD
jgi:hypothetical protein